MTSVFIKQSNQDVLPAENWRFTYEHLPKFTVYMYVLGIQKIILSSTREPSLLNRPQYSWLLCSLTSWLWFPFWWPHCSQCCPPLCLPGQWSSVSFLLRWHQQLPLWLTEQWVRHNSEKCPGKLYVQIDIKLYVQLNTFNI